MVFFRPGDLLVLHAEPRELVVKYQGALGTFFGVSAHAPHTAHDLSERQEWWERLTLHLERFQDQGDVVIMIDANATAPLSVNVHFGGLTSDKQDKNTGLIEDFVARMQTWAPSTFAECQRGPTFTWTHAATGQRSRLDYVLVPLSWKLAHIAAWVEPDLHAGHAGFDHERTAISVEWQQLVQPRRGRSGFDRDALRDPSNAHLVQQIWNSCPALEWDMTATEHAALLSGHLSRELHRRFPKRKYPKGGTSISDDTRVLHARITTLRRSLRNLSSREDMSFKHVCFQAWKQLVDREVTLDVDHRWFSLLALTKAKYARDLSLQSVRFRKQLLHDRRMFFERVANDAASAHPAEIFAALRPVLQPTKRSSAVGTTLPELRDEEGELIQSQADINSRWVRHFAQLEAGRLEELDHYVPQQLARQQAQCKPTFFEVGDLPDRLALERAIRRMKFRKAPGPDQLQTELLKPCPGHAARALYPILLKMVCRLEEPLQWKGGSIFPLYKGKGSHSECESHRGILLTSVLGKALRSSLRTKLNEPYVYCDG